MASTTIDIGTLIYKDPAMHGGKPCIAGTGMTVLAIVNLYEQGVSAEEIKAEHFPHVSMDKIFAALAYWQANQPEIDEWFRLDEEAHDAWIKEKEAREAARVEKHSR